MKTFLLILAMALGAAPATDGLIVKNAGVSRQGDRVSVNMDMDMGGVKVPSNKAVLLTPVLKSASNELELPAVGLYSRGRFLQYERMGTTMSGAQETCFHASRKPSAYHYETEVQWEDWMSSCTLELRERVYGCCGKNTLSDTISIYGYDASEDMKNVAESIPSVLVDTVYVDREVVIDKSAGLMRSIEGRAFLDYPRSQTAVDPEYHSNGVELKSMFSTLESVLQDKDCTLRRIWIKGYASPEGPRDINERLAEGRTKAIKEYISSKYALDQELFELEWEPENWEGLRNYVDASSLPNRDKILDIIDGDCAPDDKEWMIKSRYPEDFKTLLEQCLPYLRRTDYRIEYEIKQQ